MTIQYVEYEEKIFIHLQVTGTKYNFCLGTDCTTCTMGVSNPVSVECTIYEHGNSYYKIITCSIIMRV